MPITVRVRNFQSIEDATVVIDGFTVVSGPNNSGKTALMRAIRGVFTNAPPGPLVRHGTAYLRVDIDFGDGNTVTWKKGWQKPDQKGGTVNEYTVNGKKLGTKVGRGCPDEVMALGMRFIDAGTERLWPQVADQFKGVLFLVDSPGSVVAEAIADVDRVGKLSTAMKLSEKDRRAVLSTLKVRRKDVQDVEDEIETFKGFDDVVDAVKVLEQDLKKADTQWALLDFFNTLHVRWKTAHGNVSALDGAEDIPVPDGEMSREARKLASRLRELLDLSSRHGQISASFQRLDGVTELTIPAPKGALEQRDALVGLLALQGNYRVATGEVSRLEGVEGVSVPSTKALEGVRKAQTAMSFFENIKSRGLALEAEIHRLEGEIERADMELGEAQSEVGVIIGELGICPTCRRPADGHGHEEASA